MKALADEMDALVEQALLGLSPEQQAAIERVMRGQRDIAMTLIQGMLEGFARAADNSRRTV